MLAMYENQNDTLYNIEDESIRESSSVASESSASARLYALHDNEDDSRHTEKDENDLENNSLQPKSDAKSLNKSPLSIIFRILCTPVEGWKEMKRRKFTPERVASSLFYPCCAIAAASEFCQLFYTEDRSVQDCLMNALTAFVSFFFGYFSILFLAELILPRDARGILKTSFGKNYVMTNLSTLAVFFAINNIFPPLEPVFVFLPIWTAYLIYKGVKILRIEKEYETRTQFILAILIIGMPFAWNHIMSMIF